VRIALDVRAVVSEAGVRVLNQPIALGCDAIAETPWTAPAKVDDRTVAAPGLAALLILEAGGARLPRDHPALCRARPLIPTDISWPQPIDSAP